MEEYILDSDDMEDLMIAPRKMKILKWCALALCFCGLVFAIYRFVLPKHFTYYDRTWEAVYNEGWINSGLFVDFQHEPGYFTEEFTLESLQAVLPEKMGDWHVEGGRVGFLPNGQTNDVQVSLETDAGSIHLCMGDTFCRPPNLKEELVYSTCGDMNVQLYHHIDSGWDVLNAFTTVNGEHIHFSLRTDDLENAKEVFESAVECFSWYDWDRPALNKLRPSRVSEFINKKCIYDQLIELPQS